jgi:phospholipase C
VLVLLLAALLGSACSSLGAHPLVGSDPPVSPAAARGAAAHIRHVVILYKENHSFDNYFSSLEPVAGQALPHCPSFLEQPQPCQYTKDDIPGYYRYAQAFGLADRYFVDVNSESWANHMMMVAAQTPLFNNPEVQSINGVNWECPRICYDFLTIADELNQAHVSWKNYGEAIFNPFRAIRHLAGDNVHNVGDAKVFEDLGQGGLPAVSWVRPPFPDSEHPGYDVREGEQWTVDVVNAIMRSPYWSSTAILVTWDDAGDVPDHITPPLIEKTPQGGRFRFGSRVPLLVLSPYTPAGYVSHEILSSLSTTRFIESLYGLQALNQRDASANNLDQFFDFKLKPRRPLILPG